IYRRQASGTSPEEPLKPLPEPAEPWDASPDGRFLVYEQAASRARTSIGLWLLPLTGEEQPTPFLTGPFRQSEARFSPDGRWLASASDESGRVEVYVTSFPGREGKWQIANGGGEAPRWRRDCREIFYVTPDRRIHSVEVRAGAAFDAGAPKVLFAT